MSWLKLLEQAESAKNDNLILSDSVETHPYSSLIVLIICLISWAYLAMQRELKLKSVRLKIIMRNIVFQQVPMWTFANFIGNETVYCVYLRIEFRLIKAFINQSCFTATCIIMFPIGG